MKQWLTASEIAALGLDGLPTTTRGVQKLAEREEWASDASHSQPRSGREGGGGLEYHVSLLPIWSQLEYAARFINVEDGGGAAEMAAAPPKAIEGGVERDARLAIVALADRFAKTANLPTSVADGLFCCLYEAERVPVSDWVRDKVSSVSKRSLARWRSKRRSREADDLAFDRSSSRKGTSVLDRANAGEVRAHVLALIGRRPHLSAEHVRNEVIARFGEVLAMPNGNRKPVPPIRTFQRQIGIWKTEFAAELMRFGDPDRHRSTVRFALRTGRKAKRFNELWQIDASPADVITTKGRPNLYACIDVYSRRAVFLISRTPKAAALGLLIRKAILAWGVPEIIKSDNGADFVARDIERLLVGLGIEHDLCSPFQPQQKGMVERLIGTVQRDLMATLPGFIGHSVADRKVIEGQRSFASRLGEDPSKLLGVSLTERELQGELDAWALRYEARGHSALKGKTPLEVAASCIQPTRSISDPRALNILLAPVASGGGMRTVTRNGVRIDREDYITGDVMPGSQVLARHDPADLGRVYLFSPDGDEYLGEAVCPELAGLDPQETIAKARAMQKAREDGRLADIRRRERTIGPRDVLEAQRREHTAELLSFRKPETEHSTPEINAAAAVASEGPTRLAGRAAELHGQLMVELAPPADSKQPTNVTPLPSRETPRERFRRARDLERLIADGEELPTAEAIWLGRYQESAEYRTHWKMFEEFGEAALL